MTAAETKAPETGTQAGKAFEMTDALNTDTSGIDTLEAYAPDYGVAMLEMGMGDDATIRFSPFHLTHLSALAEGGFTTSVNVPIGEVEHALTVDISPDMLGQILALGTDETAEIVFSWLKTPPLSGTLELADPIEFDVSLGFGEPQENGDEVYVPLVVQSVWPVYGLLEQDPQE